MSDQQVLAVGLLNVWIKCMGNIDSVSDQQVLAVDLLNVWIKYTNDIARVVQRLDIIRNKFPWVFLLSIERWDIFFHPASKYYFILSFFNI